MIRIANLKGLCTPCCAALGITALLCCSPVHRGHVYIADSFAHAELRGKKALVVALEQVAVEYRDNTRARPERQFADTFFIDAANGLALYELSRIFLAAEPPDSLRDTVRSLCRIRYSRIDSSRNSPADAAARIRSAAQLTGAAFVALPYSCSIRHTVVRSVGWRNDKYESGHYERPTTHIAKAEFHLQLWTRNGELLYERKAHALTRQPFLYSAFKQEKKDRDIAEFSRKFFAPPHGQGACKGGAGKPAVIARLKLRAGKPSTLN